ncbi:MAG TPA: FeoB-associated Cys-rich membrane protein [Candidatus Onthocola gallistercoris]|uniref:FeoB-associated Cys-rich membrane protein n=1 Tax=Candidatus Onthocola gallistercoris TaxID=2840876 RepID=A0A9D1KW33_9FIRM|nr:FeoB-associated Cys-rich membrane protein [Candidatus Onthocola gallistercoris]
MIVNVIILGAILLYCAFVIKRQVKNMKNPGAGCCGCSGCSGCSSCGGSCQEKDYRAKAGKR